MQFLKRLSIKGILVGAIVDFGSSLIFLIFFFIVAIIIHAAAHIPLKAVTHTPIAHAISVTGGIFCSVLGGYLSARLAKHDELLNGALSAFLCIFVGLLQLATAKSHQPAYGAIWLMFAGPASGLLGGYLRLLQKQNVINR